MGGRTREEPPPDLESQTQGEHCFTRIAAAKTMEVRFLGISRKEKSMENRKINLLKMLLNTASPSGFEECAARLWKEYLHESIPDLMCYTDAYGNSIAKINPNNSSEAGILLCGHIDEVGMMVQYIDDNGFLYITKIGGFEATILPAQRVVIHNTNGPINGVIGHRPPHLADKDEDQKIKFHTVFVDIGASSKADAERLVFVGDPITFDITYAELANNRITARGLDDRIGAWTVAMVLEKLYASGQVKVPVFAAATIQEENGLYGGRMVSNYVKPSVGLAIDVTHSTDVPNVSKQKHGDCKLGGGPVLSFGSIVNKKVNSLLESVALENRIPIQKQISPRYSGTDADAIFISNSGTPAGLISIPNRYMHSPVEVVDLYDVNSAVELITKWCEAVEPEHDWK